MRHFLLTVLFVFMAVPVQAENIPNASDVVLIYQTETDTAKHQYLFTVAGDATIYPCANNRCNLGQWKDTAAITMTVYVLPEGFTSVSSVVNPAVLQSYQAAAQQAYILKDIAPQPTTTTGRAYQTVTLQADGSYVTETNSYVKPDVKEQRAGTNKNNQTDTIGSNQKIVLIAVVAVVIAAFGIVFYTKRRRI